MGVIVALEERLQVSWCDQSHLVTQLDQLPRPVMGSAARLQRDDAASLSGEERQPLPPREPTTEQADASLICPVHVKNVLRYIQTNRANLRH
jgi:hypothetical protein